MLPPSPENLRGADLLRHRCMYGSKLMSSEEIDNILRIQYKSLNSGVPYNEDYYFLVGQPSSSILQRTGHPQQNMPAFALESLPISERSVRAVCCLGSVLHHHNCKSHDQEQYSVAAIVLASASI